MVEEEDVVKNNKKNNNNIINKQMNKTNSLGLLTVGSSRRI